MSGITEGAPEAPAPDAERSRAEADILTFVREELLGGGPEVPPLERDSALTLPGPGGPEELPRLAAFVQFRLGVRLPPGPPDPSAFRSAALIVAKLGGDSAQAQRPGEEWRPARRPAPAGPEWLAPCGHGIWAVRGPAERLLRTVDHAVLASVRRDGGEAVEGPLPPGGRACAILDRMLCSGAPGPLAVRTLRRGGAGPYRPLEHQRLFTVRHVAVATDARAFQWSWIRESGRLAAALGIPCRWSETDGTVFVHGRGPRGRELLLAELHTHEARGACAVFFLEPWIAAVAAAFGRDTSRWPTEKRVENPERRVMKS